MFAEINVSPFRTNVIDLVDDDRLRTSNGSVVRVTRSGPRDTFVVTVDGAEKLRTDANSDASRFLNSLPVGYFAE